MRQLTHLARRALAGAATVALATSALAAQPSAQTYADAVLGAGPLAYWTLDAVGGTISGADASGNGYNATPLGGAAGLTAGLFGTAAAGSGAYLQAPQVGAMTGSRNVTVEAWLRLGAPLSSVGGAFGSLYDSTQDDYVLYLDKGNGELRFKVTTTNGHAERPGASALVVNKKQGDWVHVVGMLDQNDAAGASAKIYLDGVLRDRHTATRLDSTVRNGQLAAIGADWNNGNPTNFLNIGHVDQVAIYDRALTEAELRLHYELGSGKRFADSAPRVTSLKPGFEVIAHRGNSMFAPENTHVSNQQAVALGAQRFEVDVRLTKDGHAVLLHDDSTLRTTGVNRSVANSNLADLQGLSAGYSNVFGSKYAGEKIPTLADSLVLARDGGSGIVLDVKVNAAGAVIARDIAATGIAASKIVAFGWNDASVDDLVAHLGAADVFHLGFFGGFVAAGSLDARLGYLSALHGRGVDGLALSFADLLSGGEPLWGDLLSAAESTGLRVFTWTVNESEAMADLMSLQSARLIGGQWVEGRLSGIITDDPATALALVSSVPEPQSWALLLLGGCALLLRRRRRG